MGRPRRVDVAVAARTPRTRWEDEGEHVLELPGGAARRRRRRDERLTSLRGFSAAHGWAVEAALPGVVTRHPVPRLLEAGQAAPDLVVGGPWQGRRAQLASVLVRPEPARLPRGHRPDDVVLLAALEVPPVHGRYVGVVTASGLDVTGSSPELVAACGPAVGRAVAAGVLLEGDCVALGELSLAVAGPWRAGLGRAEGVTAWLDLLAVVAERVLAP